MRHPSDFKPFLPDRSGSVALAGRFWQGKKLRKEAAELAAQGANVSLYLFSWSARFHHVRYDVAGYWEQNGGLFGKATRDEPLFQLNRLRSRVRREQERVRPARG